MIQYDNKNRTLHLSNDKISYAIYINEKNVLQHLYFGTKISEIDVNSMTYFGSDWSATYFDKDSKLEQRYADNYLNDRSLLELSSHGGADKRGAPIIITHSDGTNYTDFRYVSHKIYLGKPCLQDMPSSHADDGDCETLEILLRDVRYNIDAVLSYTVFSNFSCIVRNLSIKNDSGNNIILKRVYSMELDIPESDYKLWHFHGDWAYEMKRDVCDLHDGMTRIFSNHGRSSHEENPFCMVAKSNATEDSGEVYGFSLLYSGNFSTDIIVDKWKSTRIMQGINDEDFSFELSQGEEFIAPDALVCYSNVGFGDRSRTLHDFVRNHIVPKEFSKRRQKILLNSWEGCYFDFDTEKICNLINEAKKWGCELFCLDDGWFCNRNNDENGLGDWVVDESKVDLGIISDCCKANQITFGLWFEPEMINPGSDLFKEHPEYCIMMPNVDGILWRHQLALDMSNNLVIDYLFSKMCDIIDKYDIGYIKWDNNKTLTGMYAPACEKQGEAYHRNILGTYKLLSKLTQKYPDVLFEGCASGGGRFDYGMLNYFPQIQGSDEMDPLVRMFMQYSYSYGYPFSVVGYHVNKNPIVSFLSKAKLAQFGTYGLEFDPTKYDESQRNEILQANDVFHKYHFDVIEQGDIYRLLSPYEGNAMSMISVSKDKSKALFIYMNILKESPSFKIIKLKGLEDKKKYLNSYDGCVHTGEYYRKVGLNISRGFTEFECLLIKLDETFD